MDMKKELDTERDLRKNAEAMVRKLMLELKEAEQKMRDTK
jgi:hypothetical protein